MVWKIHLPFPLPLSSSPPRGSSDDAIDVVVIELSEPCDEGGRIENLLFSLSVKNQTNMFIRTNSQ